MSRGGRGKVSYHRQSKDRKAGLKHTGRFSWSFSFFDCVGDSVCFCFDSFICIPLHVARRAMAAVDFFT